MLTRHAITVELSDFRQSLPTPMPELSWQVRRLLDVMQAELFDDGLNVETLKDRCRIRDNNVSCRFKHEVGISIRGYIETLRLDAARHLLEGGAFNASEVGMAVGYSSLQTFYRAFERRFHCTPGHLRRCGAGAAALASV
jgi:transcriptional regulator GlxA family with amidase domain